MERELDNRTSLIVDLSNGRIPPRTEEAKSRPRRRRSAGGPAGPEDLSLITSIKKNADVRAADPGRRGWGRASAWLGGSDRRVGGGALAPAWDVLLAVVQRPLKGHGEVERVKLLSPPRSVHESMILSAIKTWRFRPAMKDGQPVRYRRLIPISLPR